MGFFDQPALDPDDAVDEEHYDDGSAPWIPGVVLLESVVAQNDRAAVFLRAVYAYRDSFEIKVNAFIHHAQKFRSYEDPFGGYWGFRGSETNPPPDTFLRIGLRWPDDGKATNLDRGRQASRNAGLRAKPHIFEHQASGGSDRDHNYAFRCWPIPEAGDLALFVEWPAYAIVETSLTLDGDALRAARDRARPVWDTDSDRPDRWSATTGRILTAPE